MSFIKIIMFLFSNFSIIKNLISELMKLFKGETSKESVKDCVGEACNKIEAKRERPRWKWGRRR